MQPAVSDKLRMQADTYRGRALSKRLSTPPSAVRILGTTACVTALLWTLTLHPYAPASVLALLVLWSLTGSKQALQALSLRVLILFLNPAIYPAQGPVALLGWLVLAASGLRVFWDNIRSRGRVHPLVSWLLVFAVTVLVEFLLFSRDTLVSVFKVMSFTYAVCAVVLGFRTSARQGVNWTVWFVGLWFSVLLASFPTWFYSQVGFGVNGHGFQGILNHPQAFGVFFAPAVAFLAGKLLFAPDWRKSYWIYPLWLGALACMLLSEARTAAIAVASALALVIAAAFLGRPDWRSFLRRAVKPPVVLLGMFVLIPVAILAREALYLRAVDFIYKGQSTQAVESSFMESRASRIVEEWKDFEQFPAFGIGFGVSLDPAFRPVIDPTIGLPISAPVEKGFLPTAVLEETGLVGATAFTLLLLALFRRAFSNNELSYAWMFGTCVLTNLGEMMFFSAGGLGLYIWLLMGWATYSRTGRISAT